MFLLQNCACRKMEVKVPKWQKYNVAFQWTPDNEVDDKVTEQVRACAREFSTMTLIPEQVHEEPAAL